MSKENNTVEFNSPEDLAAFLICLEKQGVVYYTNTVTTLGRDVYIVSIKGV